MAKYSITIVDREDGGFEYRLEKPDEFTPTPNMEQAEAMSPGCLLYVSLYQRFAELLDMMEEELGAVRVVPDEVRSTPTHVEPTNDEAADELQQLFYFLNDEDLSDN